jgi:hypothetical protein
MNWKSYEELLLDPTLTAREIRRAVALSGHCEPGLDPQPGTAAVLAIRHGHGALFQLEFVNGPLAASGMTEKAWRAGQTALEVVRRELGGLRPELLAEPWSMQVRCLLDPGVRPSKRPLPLDGASLGLPAALAAVSRLLDLPPPAHLVATAEVLPDGRLQGVAGLLKKLDLLRSWTPRVQTLIVAADQPDRDPGCPRMPRLAPARDLAEAIALAWPQLDTRGLADHILSRLSPQDRPLLARQLFSLLMRGGPRVLGWRVVRLVAEGLADRLEADALLQEAAWEARTAAAIAARHSGDNDLPLPASVPASLPASLRLDLLAQRLQHAADRNDPDWEELVAEALAAAQANGLLEESARLYGAAGRLLASWGELERAEALLDQACASWQALYREEQSARPLCEWLRLRGARRDLEGVRALIRGAVHGALHHPSTDPASRAWLRVAVGRALVLAGASGEALPWLVEQPGESPDARAVRLRFRRGLDPSQDEADLAAIEALPQPLRGLTLALRRLDLGEEQALRELPEAELARLRSWQAPDDRAASHVGRWWRY